jgi:putative transferase (TIGR04331 family)
MFLATTALTELWDESQPILFLGPWCTLYTQKDRWAPLDYRIMPNPWDDRERMHQAGLYCQNLGEQLLTELSVFLNKVHKVEFNQKYWRILLGPWVFFYVDIFYDHYVCLNEAFRLFPELQTWLLDERDYRIPYDFYEFRGMQEGDFYNLQLYSQVIRGLGYLFPSKKAPPPAIISLPSANPKGKGNSLKTILRGVVRLIDTYYPASHEVIFLEANVSRAMKLGLWSTPGFRARFLAETFPPEWQFEDDTPSRHRQGLASLVPSDDSFVRMLIDSLPVNFPRIYLEKFGQSRSWLLGRFQAKGLPRVLMHMAGLWANEFNKFLGAEVSSRGGRIVDFQHGGGYGITRMIGIEWHERQTSDRFYSWGWADQETDAKLDTLVAPKLAMSNRRPGKSFRLKTILLVGNTFPRYLNRFQSWPVGSQWEEYFQGTLKFLQEVGPELQQYIIYREHVMEYGWHMSQRVKERFPGLIIDNHSRSFRSRMKQARLMVFDHFSTTFLEAIAANVPSMVFFDPRLWETRKAAQPYLDNLLQAKILHYDPKSAALQVQKIYDNIDSWWFSDEVRQSLEKFANHFALSSKDWRRQWAEMINRELRAI